MKAETESRPRVFKRHRLWWWVAEPMDGRPSMVVCRQTRTAVVEYLETTAELFRCTTLRREVPVGWRAVQFDAEKVRIGLIRHSYPYGGDPNMAGEEYRLMDELSVELAGAIRATISGPSGRHREQRRKLSAPTRGWADQDALARRAGCSSWAEWAMKVLEREVDGSCHDE